MWFEKGVRFKCTECGKCCTGHPGYVHVNESEITAIAHFLGISEEDFLKRYTKFVEGGYSLRDTPPTYDCIFLKNKRCSIYEVRPHQCSSFPFWPRIMQSKSDWKSMEKECEGMNHPDGRLYSKEEILKHFK
ncbi:MAG: hypothetical protein A3F09_02390 [Chlamydiae bacterium RIFCSPHIGHO2_12_FULL_49_11]|nr:MAG: hypothetical protein A3F09_02390 [Chlamydiae bacterium RIFCSPHIGHO2_12_FULL_49_11]